MRVSPGKWFVMQGRSQDFYAQFSKSLCPLPPTPLPEEKETTTTAFPNYRFGYVVSLRLFSAFEMTLATYKIICRVFGSID